MTDDFQGLAPAIEARNLTKTFGALRAVDGVSFSVKRGGVTGFVGANGAGKTTTMRMLATLEHPTAGNASICGVNVVDHPLRVRSILGWMPDNYGTYDNMSVLEYLDFFARAHGFKGPERHARVEDVMEFTELGPLANRLVGELSKGMGQRLCLGRALIHDPDILIMDEPAAGLDPRARVDLKNLIRVLAEDGKTIFISSHILSELEEMCDDLLFINAGRIIHHGSAETLKNNKSGVTVINVSVAEAPQRLHEWAELAPGIDKVEATRNGARFEIASIEPAAIAGTLRRLVESGIPVTEFRKEERRLEDAFIDILGELENPSTGSGQTHPPPPPPPQENQ